MLQIVTGIYFRPEAELNSTRHRAVLYSNRRSLDQDPIVLPVGELAFATDHAAISSVAVSVVETREKELPDGESDLRIASDGEQLIDDLADVLSFGLNSTFSRDHDMVRRLVVKEGAAVKRESAASHFRGTFTASLLLDPELESFREFMTQLLALERSAYERAMRAIHRMVRAMRRAEDDPTIAYADMVAALESLAEDSDLEEELTWDQLPAEKRGLVDEALVGADDERAERVRKAVMAAEKLGAGQRFRGFVKGNLSPGFFREEALTATRPIRRTDLDRALRRAYEVRSRNVHSLWDLPAEAWLFGDHAETASVPEFGTILSLEGLARLGRHVVRSFVASASTQLDSSFDWRAATPGRLMMEAAPQYWVHNASGLTHETAYRYFCGFVDHLIASVFVGPDPEAPIEVTDMRSVVRRIEALAPGTASGEPKASMIGIYKLWHALPGEDHRRPNASEFLEKHAGELAEPTMVAFVVGLLLEELFEWSTDQWKELADERHGFRMGERSGSLSPTVEASLQVQAAERLREDGRLEEATMLAARAVEEAPGTTVLLDWEARLAFSEPASIDLTALVSGTDDGSADE